jgi:putative metalloprotease
MVAAALACLGQARAFDLSGALDAGSQTLKAATLSGADIRQLSSEACKQIDRHSRIAPPGSQYDLRARQLAKALGGEVNGRPLSYKVYITSEVNAWAMTNGCIRIYSGLMDRLTDNELEGVIGHEIGHVALGHSKKAMQAAYSVSAEAEAAPPNSPNSSRVNGMAEDFINAQFSPAQESDADDYACDLLKKRRLNPRGLVSAFQKLARLGGGKNGMMDSHPSSSGRARHIEERIAASK